jgi:transcriptional antiterminator RfaH
MAGYTAIMLDLLPFPPAVERWAALRTAARWEKKLVSVLSAAGVPVFLPLMTRLTTSHGKRRAAQVPVFPGYLFASEVDFLTNKRLTPGTRAKVAQVLRPPDPALLRAELCGIADLLKDRQLVQERLVGGVGDVVRVMGGPLAGHEGRVVRVKPNRWVLVIEVSFLGARLEAEVDERLIEKVV